MKRGNGGNEIKDQLFSRMSNRKKKEESTEIRFFFSGGKKSIARQKDKMLMYLQKDVLKLNFITRKNKLEFFFSSYHLVWLRKSTMCTLKYSAP